MLTLVGARQVVSLLSQHANQLLFIALGPSWNINPKLSKLNVVLTIHLQPLIGMVTFSGVKTGLLT